MSQCARVLEVLQDGGWRSIQEIHQRAGTMRLNSRVSDLRKQGHNIEYRIIDGLHSYRLLGGSAEFPPRSLADPPSSTVRPEEDDQAGLGGSPPLTRPFSSPGPDPISPVEGPAQQSLWAAA